MATPSISHLPAYAAASAPSSTPGPLTPDQRAAAQSVIQAVKAVNSADLFGPENEITFVKDPNSNRLLTRVVTRDSHELVAQIPSEEVLRMAEEFTTG